MSNRSPLLNVIFQSLNKVTRNMLRDFGEIENLQVSPNSLEQFVSKTEKKISTSLLNDLTKSRPEWGIKFNNESDYIKDKYYWIVDSLNGRFNFLHGLPHFAISVAVELNNEILSTVIFDPIRDEFYFAEKGKGSFQNDRRIRVSKRNKLKFCVFSIFDENKLNDKNSVINYFEKINLLSYQSSSVIRSFGSSALSFAWLASGKIDCLFVNKLNKNQIACGELLIKEAGGYLTNLKYINAYDTQNDLLIGANPILHKEILKKINNKD
ncbi:MAG: inositol monophosphatase [Alphaproteobacteria bacterium]|nr:MAG: inositol monophosphatase [Alphaproteobacteria bacterium]